MQDTEDKEKTTGSNMNSSYSHITVYEFAIKLYEKIEGYGGYKGVWDLIDPSFKRQETSDKIKTPKINSTISKETFRKDVERLVNENLKERKMTFSVRGNIVLLLHVLEKMKVQSLSSLMNVSSEERSLDQYISDTNICVKEISEDLKRIDEKIQKAMKRKPRITANKICNDWFCMIFELKKILEIPVINLEGIKTQGIIHPERILYFYPTLNSFLQNFNAIHSQFGIRLLTILNNYREYFYNDTLMNKFIEDMNSLNKSFYETKNTSFILSPLYALYFITMTYKRYLFCLSSEIKEKEKDDEKENIKKNNFSFISDINFEVKDKAIYEGDNLGTYIYERINMICIKLKQILNVIWNFRLEIQENRFNEYLKIFTDVFNAICSMNTDLTKINEEWLDAYISSINNINDLYKHIILGRAYLSMPTKGHIDILNDNIEELKRIGEVLNQERVYKYG